MKVLGLSKVNCLWIEVEFDEHQWLFTIKPFGDYISTEEMEAFSVTVDDLRNVAMSKLDRVMAYFNIIIPDPVVVPEKRTSLDEGVAKFSFRIGSRHHVHS